MSKPSVNIVWFKRDLRTRDHAALAAARRAGLPVLAVYVFEPSLLALPEYNVRHGRFIRQCLDDLAQHQPLLVFYDEMLSVLEKIRRHFDVKILFSHQETGQLATFKRDKAVGRWCKQHGVGWQEFEQDGVHRARRDRIGWNKAVLRHLEASPENSAPMPLADVSATGWCTWPGDVADGATLPSGILADILTDHPDFQPGGEHNAWRYLHSFGLERAQHYSRHISRPLESRRSCSRLSPYLAWGCLSARQVWQWTGAQARFKHPISNFRSRIFWRSHFIQKFESDHTIEWRDVNRGFEGALQRGNDPALFEAWSEGRTGFPMVDACMRCLKATGYVNFRMRAMLVTFWCFTLNQDWRPGARLLAQWFLDFEPGIHYAQWQMQAGTSGYHTLRIYNPTTQCEKHDPTGAFVHQWVPELQHVPPPLVYEPWTMSAMEQTFYQCRIGADYPAPVVDFDTATRQAKDAYWAVRQSPAVVNELPELFRRFCVPKDAAKYKRENQL